MDTQFSSSTDGGASSSTDGGASAGKEALGLAIAPEAINPQETVPGAEGETLKSTVFELTCACLCWSVFKLLRAAVEFIWEFILDCAAAFLRGH